MKFYGNIDLTNNSLMDGAIVSGTTLPADGSSVVGELFYLTSGSTPGLYVYSGTTWNMSTLTKLSQMTNDVGFITASAIPTNVSAFTNDAEYITASSLPTKLSQLTNDTGFITISSVPTKLSQLTNDAGFATVASPNFTGTPTAPTATAGTNTGQLATTAFVQTALSGVSAGINYTGTWNASTNTPTLTSGTGTKGTMYKVSTAGTTSIDGNSSWSIGDMILFDGTTWDKIDGQATQVLSFNNRVGAINLTSSDVTTALGYTPVNPAAAALSGTPTAPTAAANTNTTQIATTAYVYNNYASLASPALTGTPTAPTATAGTNTTQLATTQFVTTAVSNVTAGYAPVASPTFTGVPAAPTAAAGTSTTQLATTAFVGTAISSALMYAGTWNANTNSPTLTSSTGTKGTLYKVSTAGSTALNGVSTWLVGDLVFFDGTTWDKIDGQATVVTLFNNRSGPITLTNTDVTNALGYTAANIASPNFTGTPTAPTPAANDNSENIATTAYVQTAISGQSGGGGSESIYSFFPGNLSALVGTLRYYPENTITLSQISLFCNTAPTQAIEVDLLVSGTSVFGSGSKPTIAAGSNTSGAFSLSSQTVTSSEYLTINILAGNGADMTARIDLA